jgi:hypothetical protein
VSRSTRHRHQEEYQGSDFDDVFDSGYILNAVDGPERAKVAFSNYQHDLTFLDRVKSSSTQPAASRASILAVAATEDTTPASSYRGHSDIASATSLSLIGRNGVLTTGVRAGGAKVQLQLKFRQELPKTSVHKTNLTPTRLPPLFPQRWRRAILFHRQTVWDLIFGSGALVKD